MTRLAVIRGNSLNPYEMQNYSPIEGVHFFGTLAKTELKHPNTHLLKSYNNLACRALGLQYYQPSLSKELRELDPDFVNTLELYNYDSFTGVRHAVKNNKRSVVTCWETLPSHPVFTKTIFRRYFRKYILENASFFHVPTNKARDCLLELGCPDDRIVLQHYGIDLSKFKFKKQEHEVFTYLFIGRLEQEKGIKQTIKAFNKLDNDSQLLILGNGSLRGFVEESARANKGIKYLGVKPYTEVPGVHAMADVFVLPSIPHRLWEEQYGMVFLESMAAGNPVISTSTGAIPEVVSDKEGILVKPDSVGELVKAMRLLYNDRKRLKRMSRNCRKRAERDYDAGRVAERLVKLFYS
ncbi:glycosyltransferase [archaeon]|nr:glycosyltransferase [archaeon]